jgi:hypothetical protein
MLDKAEVYRKMKAIDELKVAFDEVGIDAIVSSFSTDEHTVITLADTDDILNLISFLETERIQANIRNNSMSNASITDWANRVTENRR